MQANETLRALGDRSRQMWEWKERDCALRKEMPAPLDPVDDAETDCDDHRKDGGRLRRSRSSLGEEGMATERQVMADTRD